jgi:hypothetical protein
VRCVLRWRLSPSTYTCPKAVLVKIYMVTSLTTIGAFNAPPCTGWARGALGWVRLPLGCRLSAPSLLRRLLSGPRPHLRRFGAKVSEVGRPSPYFLARVCITLCPLTYFGYVFHRIQVCVLQNNVLPIHVKIC